VSCKCSCCSAAEGVRCAENQEEFEGKRLGPGKNSAAIKWVALGRGGKRGPVPLMARLHVYPVSGVQFSYFSSPDIT
jgi:hypothetical protein